LTNIRNLLLALGIAILTVVTIVQDAAIVRMTVTLREMRENPACMIAPIWRGKAPQPQHITPMPQHHAVRVSDN
jgi:hypothetical protein